MENQIKLDIMKMISDGLTPIEIKFVTAMAKFHGVNIACNVKLLRNCGIGEEDVIKMIASSLDEAARDDEGRLSDRNYPIRQPLFDALIESASKLTSFELDAITRFVAKSKSLAQLTVIELIDLYLECDCEMATIAELYKVTKATAMTREIVKTTNNDFYIKEVIEALETYKDDFDMTRRIIKYALTVPEPIFEIMSNAISNGINLEDYFTITASSDPKMLDAILETAIYNQSVDNAK